ncbi:MAG TPA: hypothetical protein V6C78_02735 [Crinalium sp.]|jgi:hypothetical protein
MKHELTFSLLSTMVVGLLLVSVTPASAQTVRLGDGVRVDLDDHHDTRVRPRVSSDGERLNLELEEQREPETEIRLDNGRVDVRQVEQPPRQRVDLSVPLNNRRERGDR